MYTIFKTTINYDRAIEQYQLKEQAIARMEYLAIHNVDDEARKYYVESGDLIIISEYEV